MNALRRALFAAFVVGLALPNIFSKAALALLTVLWLWNLRPPEGRAATRWPLIGPVLALSAVTVLSALLSGHPRSSLLASSGLWLAAALYVTANALRSVEAANRFLSGTGVVLAGAAAVGLLQVALCPGSAPDYGSPMWLYHRCYRARGLYKIYMTLAGVLSLILLANLPRLLLDRVFVPRLILPWLVGLGGLLATYTRGAWVGFGAGALALLPATRKGRALLLAGLVVLALVALAGPQHLRQRLLSLGDPDDGTLRERVYMWRSGLAMWREHPVLGIGPGGVKREYPRYAQPEAIKRSTSHVHNTPLQILVDRGVLGLAAWLWIWVAFYARATGLMRQLPATAVRERALVAGSLAAITGFLVGGLTEYNFGDSGVMMVVWSIMALPFVVAGDSDRGRPRAC